MRQNDDGRVVGESNGRGGVCGRVTVGEEVCGRVTVGESDGRGGVCVWEGGGGLWERVMEQMVYKRASLMCRSERVSVNGL